MKCARCHHEEKPFHDKSICSGDITCFCQEFIQPTLYNFAQLIEQMKSELKTHYQRCKFILEKIPQTRNAGSKTFYKIYNEIWHGIKIRKHASIELNPDTWKRMPVSSSVNRAKRFVKQDYPELRTYDPKMIIEQTALYQTIMEMAIER